MARVPFGTQVPITYRADEYDGVTVALRAAGVVNTEQEYSDADQNIIKSYALQTLQEALTKFNTMQVRISELPSHASEINGMIADKLTAAGYKSTVSINSINVDEESRKVIDNIIRQKLDPTAANTVNAATVNAVRPKFCPNCGTPTGASGNFCSNCGSKLA